MLEIGMVVLVEGAFTFELINEQWCLWLRKYGELPLGAILFILMLSAFRLLQRELRAVRRKRKEAERRLKTLNGTLKQKTWLRAWFRPRPLGTPARLRAWSTAAVPPRTPN